MIQKSLVLPATRTDVCQHLQQGIKAMSHPDQTFGEASCVEICVGGLAIRADIQHTSIECLLKTRRHNLALGTSLFRWGFAAHRSGGGREHRFTLQLRAHRVE